MGSTVAYAMDVATFRDPETFLETTERFLLEREAENGLPLGVALQVARAGGRAFFAVAHEGDEVRAGALWTPPHGLLLTDGPEEAARALADRACDDRLALPGVVGPDGAARTFAERWRLRTGARWSVRFEQCLYVLGRRPAPTDVPGHLRLATERDVDFIAATIVGFARDTGAGSTDVDAAGRTAAARVRAGELHVWDDDGPKSVAALTRPTPNGVAVNSVFTRRQWRGRRYAQACVGALSTLALDGGKRFCTLFADRANPISNRVYQNLGYEPIGSIVELTFEPPRA
jgi:hypothetical protein